MILMNAFIDFILIKYQFFGMIYFYMYVGDFAAYNFYSILVILTHVYNAFWICILQALEKKGKLEEALDLLKQCSYLENQDLITRLNILRRSGEIAHKLNQNELAISLYKQAIVHVAVDSEDASSLKISLAKLYMQVSLNYVLIECLYLLEWLNLGSTI